MKPSSDTNAKSPDSPTDSDHKSADIRMNESTREKPQNTPAPGRKSTPVKIIVFLLVAAAAVIGYWQFGDAITLENLADRETALREAKANAPWLVFGTGFLIYVLVTGLSLPGAAVLTIAAGWFFGLWQGTLLASFASTTGATLAFLFSRFLFRDTIQRRFGDRLRKFNAALEKEGPFYLFTLRLIPAVPFFVINIVMGLTPIRARTFWWVSQLGMLAGTIVFVYAGAAVPSLAELAERGIGGILTDQAPTMLPEDEHNRKLVSHVHPADWKNPTPSGKYNLVVIGAGTAGLVTAAAAAGLGAKVALVERHFMGGDCLNVGCVPSKAIISAARAAAAVRDAGEFGVNVPPGTGVDFAKVMERMRKLRSDISPHDSVKRFSDLGIDVFLGQGEFIDSSTLSVGDARLEFARAVICTGARASAPPIEGLDSVPHLTNETLFSLTELPKRIGIIGAGPIGCEMAQSFARFGAEVFLVESAPGILTKEDPDAAAVVQKQLVRDGVNLLCCGKDLKLSPASGGEGARLQVESEGKGYDVTVDQILVAVGRAPNIEGLGLEKIGVEHNKRGVVIDDHFRTTNKNIYAAGDVCSPYQFTHAADFMARAVIRNALFFGRAKHSSLVIPWATYTSPELAHVGLNPAEAEKRGIGIDTFTQPMSGVDRATLEGETDGFVRVHVKKGTDKIVGATIVAANAGDMIGSISIAMTQGIGLGSIANSIHPYPTQGEAVRKVGDLYNKTRLTPRVASIMKTLAAWRR